MSGRILQTMTITKMTGKIERSYRIEERCIDNERDEFGNFVVRVGFVDASGSWTECGLNPLSKMRPQRKWKVPDHVRPKKIRKEIGGYVHDFEANNDRDYARRQIDRKTKWYFRDVIAGNDDEFLSSAKTLMRFGRWVA